MCFGFARQQIDKQSVVPTVGQGCNLQDLWRPIICHQSDTNAFTRIQATHYTPYIIAAEYTGITILDQSQVTLLTLEWTPFSDRTSLEELKAGSHADMCNTVAYVFQSLVVIEQPIQHRSTAIAIIF